VDGRLSETSHKSNVSPSLQKKPRKTARTSDNSPAEINKKLGGAKHCIHGRHVQGAVQAFSVTSLGEKINEF
jgi:hypothetical protein